MHRKHGSNGTQFKGRERYCTECGRRIALERLRLLPDTWTCVRCSETPKRTDAETMSCQEDQR